MELAEKHGKSVDHAGSPMTRKIGNAPEQAYVDWIRFILFHHKQHPADMGAVQIEAFLTHLAVVGKVAASTQNQARSALLFLYKEVLGQAPPWMDDITPAKNASRLPVVLNHAEVKAVLDRIDGTHRLMAGLIYGTGMRLMEGLRLRIKDVDFERREIVVREGKGNKDRVTMLPSTLVEPLKGHLVRVKALHEDDLRQGFGSVYLPNALERKYPNAHREWAWQYVFPSRKLSIDPRSGITRRHHANEKSLQRTMQHAAGGSRRRSDQVGNASHPASQLCDTSAHGGLRHSHRSGIAGPQGCQYHHDLHPRPESRRARRRQSHGSFGVTTGWQSQDWPSAVRGLSRDRQSPAWLAVDLDRHWHAH
ncbi:hypothetical protein CCP4SC76_8200004 [Gammaproteobacteria bacterium]